MPTNREAWFAGWTAAINWVSDREDAFQNAQLAGNTLRWREPPQPPNPFPPEEVDDVDES